MKSNNQLIQELEDEGILETPEIINAFKSVDRIDFVLETDKDRAYLNIPLSVGYGQTISQPYIVAFMTEAAMVDKNSKNYGYRIVGKFLTYRKVLIKLSRKSKYQF